MFESAVGQSSQTQQLDFSCATYGGSSPGTYGPLGGSSAVNPYNDVVAEEPPLGSSNGIAQLEDAGATYGTTGVRDYTGVNFARSSRDPATSDDSGLNFVAYAKDGVPWFHFTKAAGLPTPSAKVVSLTLAQLQGIFLGSSGTAPPISLWNQVQIGVLTCKATVSIPQTSTMLHGGTNQLTVSGTFSASINPGMYVTGVDIPTGTTVVSGGGTNTITMSGNATASPTETVSFQTFNSPLCSAASQVVPTYAVPSSNTAPIIVVTAQEGSGTQSTFKTFLGKDPTSSNNVNCDTGTPNQCYGPLVVFENELDQVTPGVAPAGQWTSGQANYVTPPAGSSLPWSTAQGGSGTMSQTNLYDDMIFFYSYGKWNAQCALKDCGDLEHPLATTQYTEQLGYVGGTANPGSGLHNGTAGNTRATWTTGTAPTEGTILGNATCSEVTISSVSVEGATVSSVTVTGGTDTITVGSTFPSTVLDGMTITGTDIPSGTTVVSGGGTNTVTMSANASGSSTVSETVKFGFNTVTDSTGFAGVSVNMSITGSGIPSGTIVTAISGDTLTMSNPATATATESLLFTCGTGNTGDGLFPIARYLYNVYSNGTNTGGGTGTGIPEATAPTLNYVSEVGFICKASDAYNLDPASGKTYLSEIQYAIKYWGFYPLSAGAPWAPSTPRRSTRVTSRASTATTSCRRTPRGLEPARPTWTSSTRRRPATRRHRAPTRSTRSPPGARARPTGRSSTPRRATRPGTAWSARRAPDRAHQRLPPVTGNA